MKKIKGNQIEFTFENDDGDDQHYFTVFIDPHDNRVFARVPECKGFGTRHIDAFTDAFNYLQENFGAKQFFVLPEQLTKHFLGMETGEGFTGFDRAKATTPKSMRDAIEARSKCELPEHYKIITDRDRLNNSADELLELAKISGFLPSKIEDYGFKGVEGIKLILSNSLSIALYDSSADRFAAFCRISEFQDDLGYLCDTFVDPKLFPQSDNFSERELGTLLLYHAMLDKFDKQFEQFWLIAPKDRVPEFKQNFACVDPNELSAHGATFTVFYEAPPGPAMKKLYKKSLQAIRDNTSLAAQRDMRSLIAATELTEEGKTEEPTKEKGKQKQFVV